MTSRHAGPPGGVTVRIRRSPHVGAAAIEYRAPDNVVAVELDPSRSREPGAIAGREGFGSELFFDGSGELYALELSPPLAGLRARPASELRSAVTAARPGAVILDQLPAGPIGEWPATYADPFGAALFAFEAALEVDPQTHELVALADRVIAGVSRASSALSFIWIDGFDARQRVLGQPVSAERDGRAFIDTLNAIHMIFLTGAPATVATVAFPPAAAVGDERLAGLVDVYARMRSVDAAVDAAQHPHAR